MEYHWKKDTRWRAKAQDAGEELERITQKYDGRLTAQCVVDEARNKDSPLHKDFEWDDRAAADSWRRETARLLLRTIIVSVGNGDENKASRAFVNVVKAESDDLPSSRYYARVQDALSDPETRQYVLNKAYKEADEYRKRYEELEEVATIITAINELVLAP